MKKRSRSFNLFSMSALDIFASAMGAFILLCFILFPYYLKFPDLSRQISEASTNVGACERQTAELHSRIDRQGRQNSQAQAGLQGCLAKLKRTFIAVVMKWDSPSDDIDMYVTDPRGNVFNYQRHNRNGDHFSSDAKLSVDTEYGPGVEIWEHPDAGPGTYLVEFDFFKDRSTPGPVTVRSDVYFREGAVKLPNVTLRGAGDRRSVARIVVDQDGRATVQ